MSKILELRSKRNTLWEQTKAFLEQHRGENGLVAADAVEQYNKMAQEVKDLGAEIERLEQQAEFDAKLSAPTSNPVHGNPKNGSPKDKNTSPTGTEEYKNAFWDMIRNRGNYGEVRNALSVGVDTEGGYTVPDEFEKKLVEALEENNIFRSMANVIRTSSGTRKIPIAEDTGEASWIDEGEEIPESDTTFGQTMLSAYKLGTMIKVSNELLNRPLKTSAFMPAVAAGNKVLAFGDYSYYWIADRQSRTFRRLNELYARTDQVGFLSTQRVDGKLILPEAVQVLQMKASASSGS